MEKRSLCGKKRERAPSRWGRGLAIGTAYPSGGRGFSGASGAAPRCPPGPGRGPGFLWKKAGGRTPGRKRFFLPGPTFLVGGTLVGSLFFLPGLRPCILRPVTARPRLGGLGRWFLRQEGFFPPPKPSPWGVEQSGDCSVRSRRSHHNHRCPSAHTGADEGAIRNQPFLVERGLLTVASTCFFLCPVGQRGRPSSVTFGDSFPKGKPLG